MEMGDGERRWSRARRVRGMLEEERERGGREIRERMSIRGSCRWRRKEGRDVKEGGKGGKLFALVFVVVETDPFRSERRERDGTS
jgi:hypothetical protein